jgi:hypothetical protein
MVMLSDFCGFHVTYVDAFRENLFRNCTNRCPRTALHNEAQRKIKENFRPICCDTKSPHKKTRRALKRRRVTVRGQSPVRQ